MDAALREDPSAWQAASRLAGSWNVERSLTLLRGLAEGTAPTLVARVDALAQPRRATGAGWARSTAGGARRLRDRPGGAARATSETSPLTPARPGAIIALSGVDGAGKSSQALALAVALERPGEDPVIVWSRVRYDPLLARIGAAVKRLLGPLGAARSGTVSLRTPPVMAGGERTTDHTAPHPVIETAWAYVCAVVDGYRHRRLCSSAVLRGQIAICDRYTLDTHVHLVERFGAHPSFARGAARLDRLLSPRPLRAFWLDVPAAAAWARKPDDVDRHRLAEHAFLYRALHQEHQAIRLDAEAAAHDLAATVARIVWQARTA